MLVPFSEEDLRQIEETGSSAERVENQLERFKKGFPWMKILSPATLDRGIKALNEEETASACSYYENAGIKGKIKFVPASGAASRMFKDIFSGLAKLEAGQDAERGEALDVLSSRIQDFAFYKEEVFGTPENSREYRFHAASALLKPEGLGYGEKPKGVLDFHRYADGEVRTSFAEHLVEAQAYMRNEDGTAKLVVTVSPEHKTLFEAALSEVKDKFEKRYGLRYEVLFTYQDKATDTVAADEANRPFRKNDGSLLFRPAGHGALIYNLNKIEDEIVSIKNIDNVANERILPLISKYKKALLGKCVELRDKIFGFLNDMDSAEAAGDSEKLLSICIKAEEFLDKVLCVKLPDMEEGKARIKLARSKLNRPIRVCGMVKNEGEPGGGPFIVEGKDGCTSLQILESVQLNPSDPGHKDCLARSTHFNPVDLICCLRDYNGKKFNLLDFVDEETGFISSKSYQGRTLRALELPGLWNGAMSDWNTLFVEVPSETFNPVKVVLDLLRPAHQ